MPDLWPLGDAPLKQDHVVATPVAGFRAAMAKAGIRKDGREDLALIDAGRAVPAAAVFTKNLLAAAPVQVCRQHLASGMARAILVNSGGANAATGRPGLDASIASCRAAAQALGCDPHEVLPCSTGVIGQLLDAGKIALQLPGLAADLAAANLAMAAFAMRTTDAFTKMAQATCRVGGQEVTVVGMAKGAGMIRPDMATMLSFILTDAAATPQVLDQVLKQAVEQSFNRISVDGDTSTNDTVILMASGESGAPELKPGEAGLDDFSAAVTKVCTDLAAMIVADGEGSGHLIRMRVTGAKSDAEARQFCYSVAHSPLCKCAFTGGDPNWGRIISSFGARAARDGLSLDPAKVDLWIGGHQVAQAGLWTDQAGEDAAARAMAGPRYEIHADLGLGGGEYWVLMCDLTADYIALNTDYRS